MNKLSRRMRTVSIHLAFVMGAAALLAGACGGDGDRPAAATPAQTTSATADTTTAATPVEAPTELRVAYINLLHPVTVDAENTTPAETAGERLAIVIEELKRLEPDIIAVSEATQEAISTMIRELKMEYATFQSNPWAVGQTMQQAKELSDQLGYWEGEAILVSSQYTPERTDIHQVNPRTSVSENRSVGLMVLNGPPGVGKVNVYVTHLTDGGDEARAEQARDVAAWIEETRGEATVLLLGDFSSAADTGTYRALTEENGYADVAVAATERPAAGTCCRASVVGEQPPLTATTSYIFSKGWGATSVAVFGAEPRQRPDGTLLYASDQNGLFAVLPLSSEGLPGYRTGP